MAANPECDRTPLSVPEKSLWSNIFRPRRDRKRTRN